MAEHVEVVIKIPKYYLTHPQDYSCLAECVRRGAILPKGHGRLIDADVLREEVNLWGMNDYEPSDFTDAIDDAPTVEAIPKADYEARLKADMVAMLTELKSEMNPIKECEQQIYGKENWNFVRKCQDVIQQKIDKLKENNHND